MADTPEEFWVFFYSLQDGEQRIAGPFPNEKDASEAKKRINPKCRPWVGHHPKAKVGE